MTETCTVCWATDPYVVGGAALVLVIVVIATYWMGP